MFGITNFETFLIAAILLNITPGADTIYILSRSISQGKKAGILSAFGISTGSLVHCIIAAFGLSVIIAQSANAFITIKYLGATYLIFLGVKALITKSKNEFELEQVHIKKVSNRNIYISGILTNILNPKVALFFLAFLPQFIDPNYATNSLTFIILGLVFITTGTIWCLLLALFSAKVSDSIRNNYSIKRWLNSTTGVIFIALGIKLALSEKS
jgi:RhtB (resistance to homoserine/threonine) family protein